MVKFSLYGINMAKRNLTLKRSDLLETRQSSRPREAEEFKLLKKIGLKIKNEIVHHNTNVDRLAVESETSRGTVRRALKGEINIGLITLDRIAKAFGYDDVVEFLKDL